MPRMLWTQRQDVGPPAGSAHMAYDEKRRMITLVCVDPTSQTWLWDGELWVQVSDLGPGRLDALVWDAKRDLLVATSENSVWEWSGSDWTQVSDQITGPGTTAFEGRRERLTRVTSKPDSRSLTWEWSDSAWTQVDEMGPPNRAEFNLVYDDERGVLLLAGGVLSVPALGGGFRQDPVSDTWTRDNKWKCVADIGPSPRVQNVSAYDGDRSRVVLFGGIKVPNGELPHDTWEWDGALWRQVQDMGPSGRMKAAMAYDKGRKRLVLFGGFGDRGAHFGDTWEYFDLP